MGKLRGVLDLPKDARQNRDTFPIVGTLIIITSSKALHCVLWESDLQNQECFEIVNKIPIQKCPVSDETVKQLHQYFSGERQAFDLPLQYRGTEFQMSVWQALREIKFGGKASYSEQAKKIGNPKAVRAVGSANGVNPISIIIPCHRVIASDGGLGGFGGGLAAKQALLDFEQSVLKKNCKRKRIDEKQNEVGIGVSDLFARRTMKTSSIEELTSESALHGAKI